MTTLSSLTVNGAIINTDKEGYLSNLHDWSPEVAQALAQQEGIELDERLRIHPS